MKLRKALDKARETRARIPEPVDKDREIKANKPDPVSKAGEKRVRGWKAPQYTESTTCLLDPVVTERNKGVCLNPNPDEIERYKILRTRINQNRAGKPMNTIMITSPWHGEGKTVTCINMGFTFARELNHTVVLVDCDFRGQDIHRYLGIENTKSLIDYFLDDVPLKDLIIWPGVEKLTLISGSRTVLGIIGTALFKYDGKIDQGNGQPVRGPVCIF